MDRNTQWHAPQDARHRLIAIGDLRDAAVAASPTGPALLIIDDQPQVLQGLMALAQSLAVPWHNVHGVSTAKAGRERVALVPTDIIVLDGDLAGDDGLCLLPEFVGRARVIVLTAGADTHTRHRARSLGAAALIDKNAPANGLAAALMSLAAPRF